jgi:hypothetical protein
MSDRHGMELKPGAPVLLYCGDETVVPATVLSQDGPRYQIEVGPPTPPRAALPVSTVQAMLSAAQAEVDAILTAAGQPSIDVADPCWVDGSELEFLGQGGFGVWGLDELLHRAARVSPDDSPYSLGIRLMTHVPRDERRPELIQTVHQYVLDEHPHQGEDGRISPEALAFLSCIVLLRATNVELLSMIRARIPHLSPVELVSLQMFLRLPLTHQRTVYVLTCRQRREWVEEISPKWRAKARELQRELRVTSGRFLRTLRKIASKDLAGVPSESIFYATIMLDMMCAERYRNPDSFAVEQI